MFGAALANGRTAKAYMESMPSNCYLWTADRYAVRHNPWAYFTAERDDCSNWDKPLAAFAGDVRAGSLPNVGMLMPNLDNDAHDGTLGTADASQDHHVVTQPLNHYSLAGLYADVSHTARLENAATAPGFASAFDLPIG